MPGVEGDEPNPVGWFEGCSEDSGTSDWLCVRVPAAPPRSGLKAAPSASLAIPTCSARYLGAMGSDPRGGRKMPSAVPGRAGQCAMRNNLDERSIPGGRSLAAAWCQLMVSSSGRTSMGPERQAALCDRPEVGCGLCAGRHLGTLARHRRRGRHSIVCGHHLRTQRDDGDHP